MIRSSDHLRRVHHITRTALGIPRSSVHTGRFNSVQVSESVAAGASGSVIDGPGGCVIAGSSGSVFVGQSGSVIAG